MIPQLPHPLEELESLCVAAFGGRRPELQLSAEPYVAPNGATMRVVVARVSPSASPHHVQATGDTPRLAIETLIAVFRGLLATGWRAS